MLATLASPLPIASGHRRGLVAFLAGCLAGAALFWHTGFPRLPDTALDFRTPAPWEPPAPPVSAPSARPAPAGAADGPAREQRSLEIVFDVNSSFLPAGAGEDLRRLLAGLAPDRVHGIELAAAVNGGRARGAPALTRLGGATAGSPSVGSSASRDGCARNPC